MQFTRRYRAKLVTKSYSNYIRPHDRVLDIGCGDGIVGLQIANALQCEITGTDLLDYLRVPMSFDLMSSPHLVPFPSQTFDVAMLNEVLHHMNFENQEMVIREALRVASRVVVFEMRQTYFSMVMDVGFNWLINRYMATPFTFRSFDQWSELMSGVGCVLDAQRVPKPFWGFPFDHFAFHVTKQ